MEVVTMYRMLVIVWPSHITNYVLKLSAVGWGIPLLVTTVTLITHFIMKGDGTDESCMMYRIYRETGV